MNMMFCCDVEKSVDAQIGLTLVKSDKSPWKSALVGKRDRKPSSIDTISDFDSSRCTGDRSSIPWLETRVIAPVFLKEKILRLAD